MKYYLLRMSSDPRIIGVKNGIAQIEFGEKENADNPSFKEVLNFFNSLNYWQNELTVPNFDIHLNATPLKNVNFTDFVTFRPYLITCPFLVNEAVISIFNRFNVQKYYLYPVTIFGKKVEDKRYKLFCCPLLGYDIINFQKSVFYEGSDLLGKKYHYFKSKEDYASFIKQYNILLTAEVLHMNANFDNSLDFFVGRVGEMHVSERLKEALEKNNLTGVKMLENVGPKIICD